ncbi:MAG TPA: radical SAM protein [Burkholderiales bacterium]|nr:radical SAM protein [Burkholderiales bacterium]
MLDLGAPQLDITAAKRFAPGDYVELTVHFKCNLKCVHCMIEGTMDWLKPESMEQFERVVASNARQRLWKGMILTGSEVTLRRDLPELARKARGGGFEHVRIQTHGMRLADAQYCRELVEAGVDEFFVSVTAADAATHDAITEVPGSFERTVRGLENLDAFDGVVSLTNTVITQRSFRQLAQVVERLGHLRRLAQMQFWNYWPMRETDDKDLVASHLDVLPHLRAAIAAAKRLGREVEVKNFPECLLGTDRDALDNDQPKLIIDPEFWPEFMRNGFHQCVHRSYCGARRCLGLNTAYVNKFGWHADVLVPFPREP